MSTFVRAQARLIPIRRQLRFYKSKTPLKPQSEDALKIWEELSALDLEDPKQLFDDSVISKNNDAEIEEDDRASGLPISPIMDAKSWKRRFKSEPKLSKVHPSEMTEKELRLMKSPYANALATSTRLDAFFSRSLPSFFLQKFKVFVHPETKDPWILPVGIRSRDTTKVVPGTSKYVGSNYTSVEFLKTKRWKKLLDVKFVIFGVWRSDSADFVLKQLQERGYEEVAKSQRWIMSANREGGKWEDMDIGCILAWGNTAPSRTIAKTDDEENIDRVADQSADEALQEQEPSKQAEEVAEEAPRTLVRVKDKLVPRYDMAALFGPEKAAELKKQLKIEATVKQNIMLTSVRTTKAQMWLWKLGGYTRKYGTSLFDGI